MNSRSLIQPEGQSPWRVGAPDGARHRPRSARAPKGDKAWTPRHVRSALGVALLLLSSSLFVLLGAPDAAVPLLNSPEGLGPPLPIVTTHAPVALPSPPVGSTSGSTAFGGFRAPRGPPDSPVQAFESSSGSNELDHRTIVSPLIAAMGGRYGYGGGTGWLAYASWNKAFYVAVAPSSIDVIAASNATVTAVIAVGLEPTGVAVNPATQQVFVTNAGSGNVSVINGSSQQSVGSIQVQASPAGIAYDITDDSWFVADNATDNVSVISGSNLSVVRNVPAGFAPFGVVWDPATDRVFVSDRAAGEVTVLSGVDGSFVAALPVGSRPLGMALDNASDTVYVANEGSSNVSAIWAGGLTVNASVPIVSSGYIPDLQGVAYDSAHDVVWVTTGVSVVVIDPGLQRAVNQLYYDPAGVAYDPTTGEVCVTNSANVTFGCFVFGSAMSTEENLTFVESGLPTGSTWSVSLKSTTSFAAVSLSATSASMTFGVDAWPWYPNVYNFSYVLGPVSGYAGSPGSGFATANASTSLTINVTFVPDGLYSVSLWEQGLPPGTNWSATLANTSANWSGDSVNSLIRFYVANGSYVYAVAPISGWTTMGGNGSLTVNGGALSFTVVWSQPAVYPVTFSETGLPTGTTWSLVVTAVVSTTYVSSTSTISFSEINGTYGYSVPPLVGWQSSQPNGSFLVAGAPVAVSVPWVHMVTYPVTFAETGLLTNGTAWTVQLRTLGNASTNLTSTSSSVTFSEPNGTYTFSIRAITAHGVTEYSPSPATGGVTVSGSGVLQAVRFALAAGFYPVAFTESGLVYSSSWSVSIAGQGFSANSATLVIPETNGTYFYTISGPGGYNPNSTSGWVLVRGMAVNVSVSFALAAGYYEVTFLERGLPNGAVWQVTLGGTALSTPVSAILFPEMNGTYNFTVRELAGYSASPSSGTVTVAGAAPATIWIQFNSTDVYAVSFSESGLPSGTGWAVSIGDKIASSLTNQVVLDEPNGTFGYLILPVNGYLSAGSGFVTVNGTNVSVQVAFSPQSYPVIVVEFGLPNGTSWTVNVTGVSRAFSASYTTNSSAVIFYLPNGTYSLTVVAAGFVANLSSPYFTVAGLAPGGGPTVHFGRPGPAGGSLVGAGVLELLLLGTGSVAFVVGLIVWLYSRRGRRREGETWVRELVGDGRESEVTPVQ